VRRQVRRVTDEITIRDVTDPSDPAIEAFGRIQTAAYFAPETLIPARYIPQMLSGESSAITDCLSYLIFQLP